MLNAPRRKRLSKDDQDFHHVGYLEIIKRFTINLLQNPIFAYDVRCFELFLQKSTNATEFYNEPKNVPKALMHQLKKKCITATPKKC